MSFDLDLADRMRKIINNESIAEKKMFGGIGFLINGNMACGVHKNDLIVRVGPEKYQAALARPHTHVFDMTGRPMAGTTATPAEHSANPYVSLREERYSLWASPHRTQRPGCIMEALRGKELDCHGFAAG